MRIIKFRGKLHKKDMWLYGSYLYDNIHNRHFILVYDITGNIRENKVSSKFVGQFTGQHDKNGDEIYHLDHVKGIFDGDKVSGIVFFWKSGWYVGYDDGKYKNLHSLSALIDLEVL